MMVTNVSVFVGGIHDFFVKFGDIDCVYIVALLFMYFQSPTLNPCFSSPRNSSRIKKHTQEPPQYVQ
jgi:hypothetical protein